MTAKIDVYVHRKKYGRFTHFLCHILNKFSWNATRDMSKYMVSTQKNNIMHNKKMTFMQCFYILLKGTLRGNK